MKPSESDKPETGDNKQAPKVEPETESSHGKDFRKYQKKSKRRGLRPKGQQGLIDFEFPNDSRSKD